MSCTPSRRSSGGVPRQSATITTVRVAARIDSLRDLFVYGTLMDEAILMQLIGRRIASVPATLFGFRRVQNPDSYPYLLRSDHGRVRGQLLRRLRPAELRVLDQYEDEGRLYLRQVVTVRSAAVDVPAFTYIGIADALQRVRRSHFDDNRSELARAPQA